MFHLRKKSMKVAPYDFLPQPSQAAPEVYEEDGSEGSDEAFLKRFTFASSSDLLDIEVLPEPFSKECRRLYKIQEFGQKFAATIVNLSYQVDIVLDEMIIELYPNVVYFRPDLMDEKPHTAADVDAKKKPKNPHPAPASDSSPGSKTSEINCCLWVLLEALDMARSGVDTEKVPSTQFLKVKLKTLSKGLEALNDELIEYLYKFDNLQQLLASISNQMTADHRKYKASAKEHYEKYLLTCEPNSIRPIVLEKLESTDEMPRMKFVCTPTGYEIVKEATAEDGAGDPGIFEPTEEPNHPLPPDLHSEILYSIIREMEFRINKCVVATRPALSKLSRSHPQGLRLPLDHLLHLAQYCGGGLKLCSNAAVSLLFALKRIKAKMELFKSVLVKFQRNVDVARHMIQNLGKSMGKGSLQKPVGDHGGGGDYPEQMLRYIREKLVKESTQLEISLFTDWPDYFKDYIAPADRDGQISRIPRRNTGQGDGWVKTKYSSIANRLSE